MEKNFQIPPWKKSGELAICTMWYNVKKNQNSWAYTPILNLHAFLRKCQLMLNHYFTKEGTDCRPRAEEEICFNNTKHILSLHLKARVEEAGLHYLGSVSNSIKHWDLTLIYLPLKVIALCPFL